MGCVRQRAFPASQSIVAQQGRCGNSAVCPSPIEKSRFLPDRNVTRVRAMSGLRLQADDPAPQVGHRVASPGAVIGVPACTAQQS